jgi:hypothetical protein
MAPARLATIPEARTGPDKSEHFASGVPARFALYN